MPVQIRHGADDDIAEAAEMTVGEVREQYQAPFNIAPGATALVNNEEVDDKYVLKDGDKLEFMKSAESKW